MNRAVRLLSLLLFCFCLENGLRLAPEPHRPTPPRLAEAEDDVRERMDQFYRERAYPFSRIPEGARLRAMAQTEELRRSALGRAVTPGHWRNLGPFSARSGPEIGWSSTSGRIRAIAVHPDNPNIVYVGGAQGGVWKSTDAGASFVPLTDKLPSLAIGALAVSPSNPNTLYAGTGEVAYGADCYFGAGLLKSTDGGATWTTLGTAQFSKVGVSKVLIDPRDENTLLVGTGLTGYTPTGSNTPTVGVYRSTNGGQTWTNTTSAVFGAAWDLARDPTNPDKIYAAINGFEAGASGFYRSTNGGQTWTGPITGTGLPSFTAGESFIKLAAGTNNAVYLMAGDYSTQRGVYKSTNGGSTWTQLVTAPDTCENQCWYGQYIAVHPLDSNRVFMGGIGWARSTDGGAHWDKTFPGYVDPGKWYEAPVHVDHQAIAFDPVDPDTFYLGSDGGLWKTFNDGVTWLDLNPTGLALAQFYHVALHPTSKNYMLAGAQDNSPQQYTGDLIWNAISTGDGAYSAINPQNPNVQYVSVQYLNLLRTTNGGAEWFFLAPPPDPGVGFIAPYLLDPINPSKIWAGATRLYMSPNQGDQWTAVGPSWGDAAQTLAVSGGSPQTIYMGTLYGTVQVSTNTGQTFADRSAELPARAIKEIACEIDHGQNAYAVVSGFGTGHVFRTTNAGVHWTDISGNLPDVPVNTIALDLTRNPVTLWVGTDTGIFRSNDQGATWQDQSNGLPNVAVFKLAYNPGTRQLVAATHGRGIWEWTPATSQTVPATGLEATLLSALALLAALLHRKTRNRGVQRASALCRARAEPA